MAQLVCNCRWGKRKSDVGYITVLQVYQIVTCIYIYILEVGID